ncbi:D-amino-acid transaminase [Rhizobium sp. L1K21]|uniref:D-amino-acid transaminase n=1 Tax=Rhizobium sp. L1K21 TaxID=2954933 RepID=UPI00209362F1|nr:D-amino-acid transaminase [Rhizobium sp. L1K21]MCO6185270.1 D-amino-acid transaminase [Rhizobium sp. L1K21]
MRIVYVNGHYVPENEASVSVFDRGFLFADAVYEVTSVLDGKLLDFKGHYERLKRSLNELDMPFSMTEEELLAAHRKLVAENNIDEGLVYLQVTRGAADRDFVYPDASTPNTVVMFTQSKSLTGKPIEELSMKVITVDDLRWQRCDIKTVQLLYPSIVKNMAKKQGADDGWLVRDGVITEGSSNNAYIVTEEGTIVTRDLSHSILAGITRASVLECARQLQMKVEERPFTVEEAKAAKEAFVSSATTFVYPVVQIDEAVIGTGKPGPVAAKLREIYIENSRATAI